MAHTLTHDPAAYVSMFNFNPEFTKGFLTGDDVHIIQECKAGKYYGGKLKNGIYKNRQNYAAWMFGLMIV